MLSLIAIKVLLYYLLILAFFVCYSAKDVDAQNQSISIYPPIITIDVQPPSSPEIPIIIQNNGASEVMLDIELVPFKQLGKNGDVVLDHSLISTGFYASYRDKIQFLDGGRKTIQITLDALETREIILNINLDEGDPSGDYYFSVVFSSRGGHQEDTSLSSIPAGIATNLLLSVGPKDDTLGGIAEFSTPFFRTEGPVEFSLLVHNASKHFIRPSGVVEVEDIFGRKMAEIDILPQYILSGSDRYLLDNKSASQEGKLSYSNGIFTPKIAWKEQFLLGIYKATAKVQLDQNSSIIDSSTYFVAFPFYFLIGLTVLLFITISIYLRVRKKIH